MIKKMIGQYILEGSIIKNNLRYAKDIRLTVYKANRNKYENFYFEIEEINKDCCWKIVYNNFIENKEKLCKKITIQYDISVELNDLDFPEN